MYDSIGKQNCLINKILIIKQLYFSNEVFNFVISVKIILIFKKNLSKKPHIYNQQPITIASDWKFISLLINIINERNSNSVVYNNNYYNISSIRESLLFNIILHSTKQFLPIVSKHFKNYSVTFRCKSSKSWQRINFSH